MSPPSITFLSSLSCCSITSWEWFHLWTIAGSINIRACRRKVSYRKICRCIALNTWKIGLDNVKHMPCSTLGQIIIYLFTHLPFEVWRKRLHWCTLLQVPSWCAIQKRLALPNSGILAILTQLFHWYECPKPFGFNSTYTLAHSTHIEQLHETGLVHYVLPYLMFGSGFSISGGVERYRWISNSFK